MNIRTRLAKLEARTGVNKPLFDMTNGELERFITRKFGLALGATITDDMLWKIINDGETVISSVTHEEALDILDKER